MWRHHINALRYFQARAVSIHNESANAPGARRLTCACKHHVKIGNAPIGNPSLQTIQAITIGSSKRTALHSGYIRSCIGLTQRKSRQRFPLGHTRQISGLLLRCSFETDSARAQPLHGKRKVGQAMMPSQLLAQQTNGAGVNHLRCSAMRLARYGRLKPTTLSQSFDQTHTFTVDGVARFIVAMLICKLLRGPLLQLSFENSMRLIKERPCQVRG